MSDFSSSLDGTDQWQTVQVVPSGTSSGAAIADFGSLGIIPQICSEAFVACEECPPDTSRTWLLHVECAPFQDAVSLTEKLL